MQEREVILKFGDYEGIRVSTNFPAVDLEVAAEGIIESIQDSDSDNVVETDGKDVIRRLEVLGYCKVLGSPCEVIEIGPIF